MAGGCKITVDGNRLGTAGFYCAPGHTHVPILRKQSPHARWKRQELTRRFSTLPAAGAAGHGLAPLLPALLFGPPVG